MTATVVAFPVVNRPARRKAKSSKTSAIIIILPVIRIERHGEPKPPRLPKYEDMRS